MEQREVKQRIIGLLTAVRKVDESPPGEAVKEFEQSLAVLTEGLLQVEIDYPETGSVRGALLAAAEGLQAPVTQMVAAFIAVFRYLSDAHDAEDHRESMEILRELSLRLAGEPD